MQTTHADIAAGITPFDRVLQGNDAVSHMLNPATRHGAAMLDQMINHQAQIIAYNNDFRLMMLTIIPPLLLLFLCASMHERRRRREIEGRQAATELHRVHTEFHRGTIWPCAPKRREAPMMFSSLHS